MQQQQQQETEVDPTRLCYCGADGSDPAVRQITLECNQCRIRYHTDCLDTVKSGRQPYILPGDEYFNFVCRHCAHGHGLPEEQLQRLSTGWIDVAHILLMALNHRTEGITAAETRSLADSELPAEERDETRYMYFEPYMSTVAGERPGKAWVSVLTCELANKHLGILKGDNRRYYHYRGDVGELLRFQWVYFWPEKEPPNTWINSLSSALSTNSAVTPGSLLKQQQGQTANVPKSGKGDARYQSGKSNYDLMGTYALTMPERTPASYDDSAAARRGTVKTVKAQRVKSNAAAVSASASATGAGTIDDIPAEGSMVASSVTVKRKVTRTNDLSSAAGVMVSSGLEAVLATTNDGSVPMPVIKRAKVRQTASHRDSLNLASDSSDEEYARGETHAKKKSRKSSSAAAAASTATSSSRKKQSSKRRSRKFFFDDDDDDDGDEDDDGFANSDDEVEYNSGRNKNGKQKAAEKAVQSERSQWVTPMFPDPRNENGRVRFVYHQWLVTDGEMKICPDKLTVSNSGGYRSIKATHGVSEGTWYYECDVMQCDNPAAMSRIGFSMISGSQQGPVGCDYFGYSYRLNPGTAFHYGIKRGNGLACKPGQTLGIMIHIPPLNPEQRRVIKQRRNDYTKEYDVIEQPGPAEMPASLINEYKQRVPALHVANGSWMRFFVDGKDSGVLLTDLYLGKYYPAISIYQEGVIKANFGPVFKHMPQVECEYKAISMLQNMADIDDPAIDFPALPDLQEQPTPPPSPTTHSAPPIQASAAFDHHTSPTKPASVNFTHQQQQPQEPFTGISPVRSNTAAPMQQPAYAPVLLQPMTVTSPLSMNHAAHLSAPPQQQSTHPLTSTVASVPATTALSAAAATSTTSVSTPELPMRDELSLRM